MESVRDRMRAFDRVAREDTASARRMRERHAARYVRVFRPALMATMLLLVAISEVVKPADDRMLAVWTTVFAVGVSLVSLAVWNRVDPLRIAAGTAVIDLVLVLVYVCTSPFPAQTAVILLWPVIVLSYMGTARGAAMAAMGACAVVWVVMVWGGNERWNDALPIPTSLLGVIGSGILIGFVSQQGRRVEHALAAALARDRVAFLLAQRIRMADDPGEAIEQIATVMGDATGATQSLVLLLEHDEDFVADLATWHRTDDATAVSPMVGRDVLDATLLHMVASGFGAALEHGHVRLLNPQASFERSMGGAASVDASVQALFETISARSGVVVPLQIAARVVGAVVLAAEDEQHEWSAMALPLLEQLAPQLAAGLAQAVLLRDQREALDSLERVDRMRDRLIANVSHELRTPLTSTIGFVETVLRDDVQIDETTRHDLLAHAKDGGMRLLALVEDLLALGSTRPESLDLDPEPLDASTLVADAVRGIEEPEQRRIVVVAAPGTRLVADRNRTIQVVTNLVTNALHHGRGDVLVRASSDANGFVLDVIDDGDGIAAEHVGELFLPFSSFSSRTDSTGLGLAICRAIVESHGGSIDYERIEHGSRTRFRVRLPLRAS